MRPSRPWNLRDPSHLEALGKCVPPPFFSALHPSANTPSEVRQEFSAITDCLAFQAKRYDISNLKATGPALELQILRHQMSLINCEDANHNTPLSEAAAGGSGETIEFLISKGADVNSRGAFRRTPLYRAAFGGHFNAVQVLSAYHFALLIFSVACQMRHYSWGS